MDIYNSKWKSIYTLKRHEVDQAPTDIAMNFAKIWALGVKGGINTTTNVLIFKGIVIELPEENNFLENSPTHFTIYTEIPGMPGRYMEKKFQIVGYDILISSDVRMVEKLPKELITEQ
jgi:hypothetical protein